jgi:ATPase subunit of ABC transporter with duplicated ATPase domains
MLHVNQVSKYYGPQLILEDISFSVTPGERVGLVGPNGCGKSTLLRIIAGVERPDDGHVSFDSGVTLGYLPQGHDSSPDRTIAEEVRAGVQGLDIAWRKMEDLAGQMTTATGDEQLRLVEAYGEAQTRFEALGGYAVEHRIPSILAGLGLESLSLDAPLSQLSGGQRARVGLARLLIAEPTFLIISSV